MNTSNEPDRPHHEKLLREAVADIDTETQASGAPVFDPATLGARLADTDFDILELIGRGGMGAVYKAVQRKLGRVVAVKVLPEELAAEPGFSERFEQEARALASLNHANILTVHDFGETDGLCYLVTEYVDGINLHQLMEMGQLSPAEALRIAPQICQALQYAHEHGVVHRDVKPANILIDTDGNVKIADFGLAKLTRADAQLTRNTQVFGTPQYMAPEQWRGSGRVDHRADIFSLGVVLYEMLTGQLPVGHFDPPSQRAGVPRGLDQVVQRSLAQQPENRYQNVADVKHDVERQASSAGSRDPARRDRGNRSRTHKFSWTFVFVCVFVIASLSGLAIWSNYMKAVGRNEAGASRQPIKPAELLGKDADYVLSRLGPPVDITASASESQWAYLTAEGRMIESAFVFTNGTVAYYHPEAPRIVPNAKPERGPYLGQSLADLVRELGTPTSKATGQMTVNYEFADGTEATVAHGHVIGFVR